MFFFHFRVSTSFQFLLFQPGRNAVNIGLGLVIFNMGNPSPPPFPTHFLLHSAVINSSPGSSHFEHHNKNSNWFFTYFQSFKERNIIFSGWLLSSLKVIF